MKTKSKLNPSDFRKKIGAKKTELYILRNNSGMEMSVTNFGARIVELFAPDRKGRFADIVLGYSTLAEYVKPRGERFFGAVIGRCANRIANGRFKMSGKTFKLALNNGCNSLHGGDKAFDMRVWDACQTGAGTLELSYLSADGEEGYPGNLRVFMTYALSDANALTITYRAVCDKATICNLTHHSFFNLRGAGACDIGRHSMLINSDYYTPINENLIPIGRLAKVEGTPMDFRRPVMIGERIDSPFRQLEFAGGYDHNWVLKRKTAKSLEFAARVSEESSGRTLELYTTQPGMQFYAGNFLDGKSVGKGGKAYARRTAFALETQHFPDSPNQASFPSTVLNPKEAYFQVCEYRFGVEK